MWGGADVSYVFGRINFVFCQYLRMMARHDVTPLLALDMALMKISACCGQSSENPSWLVDTNVEREKRQCFGERRVETKKEGTDRKAV